MKIICINGQGGVGKDSFVFFCGSPFSGIYNYSMIDGVKNIATLIGWDGGKGLKDRKFLSDLKDLVDDYNDYSFRNVLDHLKFTFFGHMDKLNKEREADDEEPVCFIHAREPKDIERWRNSCGARAVLIRRFDTEGEYGNHADDHVFDCEYDYYIYNNGTLEDLREAAHKFIEEIRKEDWESNIWE